MTRTLLVGTRASTLARTQAGTVRDVLCAQTATENIDGAELQIGRAHV